MSGLADYYIAANGTVENDSQFVSLFVLQIQLAVVSVGTVENRGKKWLKTRQTFVKIAKITAKIRHHITGPKTIIQSIKVNI